MYQPSTPWGAHVSLMLSFSWTRSLVQGGGVCCSRMPTELGMCRETGVDAQSLHEVERDKRLWQ
jgi:hypothetical protein